MGIYEPMWRYDKKTLAKDLGAHLRFGVVTAAADRLLERGVPAASRPRHRTAE
jgi:hypothetical protein